MNIDRQACRQVDRHKHTNAYINTPETYSFTNDK